MMPANKRWSSSFRGGGSNQNRFGGIRGGQDSGGYGYGSRDSSSGLDGGYTRRERNSSSGFGERSLRGYGGQGHGYLTSTHGQPRNMGDVNRGNRMVSPWEGGVVPTGGTVTTSHGGNLGHPGGGFRSPGGGFGNPGGSFGSSGGSFGSPAGGLMPHPPTAGGSGTSLLGEYRGGGTADVVGSIRHLSKMENPESKLALNILNAVLSTRGSGVQDQSGWNNELPSNKMRHMDLGGDYDNYRGQTVAPSMHQPAHKFPRRDLQYGPRRAGDSQSPRRARGGRFIGQAGRQMTTVHQSRKTVIAKKGTAKDNKGLAKNQKKEKGEATPAPTTGTTGGPKGDKTEGDGSSDTADPNQSGEVIKQEKELKNENVDGSSSEEKEKENTTDSGEKTESKESKKKDTPKKVRSDGVIPKEALQCHMCNFYQFNSLQGFKNHLESRNHEQMERTFHAKGAAILHLLRSQAKVAAQRNILKLRRKGMKGRIGTCSKCDCSFMGSVVEHTKTREHYLVSNYTKCSPCRIWFDSRAGLEKHRLSYVHLMRQMMIDQDRLEKASKAKKTEGARIPENESSKKVHDAVAKLKITHSIKNVWNTNRIPFYDPAAPIGLNFIMKKPNFFCKICPNKTVQTAKEAYAHFCSRDHYDNYVGYIKNLEENKELEKTEEEENCNIKNQQNDGDLEERDQKLKYIQEEIKEEEKTGEDDEDVIIEGPNDVEMLEEEIDKTDMDTATNAEDIKNNKVENLDNILKDELEVTPAVVVEEAQSDVGKRKNKPKKSEDSADDKKTSSKDKIIVDSAEKAPAVEEAVSQKTKEAEKNEEKAKALPTVCTPRRRGRGRCTKK